MKLNKRYLRSLKSNLAYYVSVTFLTAIAAFLLVSMYTSVAMIDQGFRAVLRDGNVEDAQFTTLNPISLLEIQALEERFDLTLEKIQTVDIDENGYTLRIFAPTQKINRYQMLEGRDISTPREILLNRDFARAHDLSLGQQFTIRGRAYTISGLAVRPDYLYAQKDIRDFYLDKYIFGQVTLSPEDFAELENTQAYYAVIYHAPNSVEFRRRLNTQYTLLSYLNSDSNNRIATVKEFAPEYGVMLGGLIPPLFVMITLIVAVVIGRVVRREQKQIGTLVALGYRRRELARHYALYAVIPGLLGSVIGILLAIFFLQPVCLLFASDFERINFEVKIYAVSLVIALLTPVLLYGLTAVFSVHRLLRKNTVWLLSGVYDAARRKGRRWLVHSRLSFDKKFRLRALIAHKSRTLVVVMGMFVGTFLCAFGLIMIDSCNYLIEKGLDSAGTFEYQYYLNTLAGGSPPGGEQQLCFNLEVPGSDKLFALCGITPNPRLLNLSTSSGSPFQYGEYYLTSNAAVLYGVEAGDRFSFINPFTTESYTVTIADILDDNTRCVLYTSLPAAAGLLGLPPDSYNLVLSDRPLELDSGSVAYSISRENLKQQFRYTIDLILVFVYFLLAFGAILCLITVYLTVNMLVEENRHNISMLKVLGYRKPEINRLVLNVNHILVPVSFALSILACLQLSGQMFKEFINVLNIYIEPTISILSLVLCAAVLVVSYFISLSLLKHKVYKIDMVESLKDNRE